MKNNLGIHPVVGTDNPDRQLDLLFIHGLGGDAWSTWQYENKTEYFWPNVVGLDFPEIGVWTIAYGAAPSKWIEDVMPMEDRAENLLNHFIANGIGKRPFALVVHSMGGLIAKYMLTQADHSNDPEYKEIAMNCRGVAFLAVPHNGSGWSDLLGYARVLVRGNKIVAQLAKDNSSLRQLSKNFQYYSQRNNLACHAFIETREVRYKPKRLGLFALPFSKGIKIVSESSAGDTELVRPPVPMDDDHLSICKLTSKQDLLYMRLQTIIKDYLAGSSGTMTNEKKKNEEEIRSHRHWLYHTLAHDYIRYHSVKKHFSQKNYFVGFYTGRREDMPYSFAVHYYTKLKMPVLADEVWDQVREVELDGAGTNSFRDGLHRLLLPDGYLQYDTPTLNERVKDKFRAERILVFNVQITVRRKTDAIIKGAIHYLKQLDIQNAHVAVLFNSRHVTVAGSPVVEGALPEGCHDMQALRMLEPPDVNQWIEDVEKKEVDVAQLEKELAPFNEQPSFTYRTILNELEKLSPQQVLKGKYS